MVLIMTNMRIYFIICILWALTCCNNKGEPEIFILPEGYTGCVLVIFNQKNGQPIEYSGSSRVYRIPPSGILMSQFSTNKGWKDLPRFYYKKINDQNEIPVKADFEDLSSIETNATLSSFGKAYKNIDGTGEVQFLESYVGTKEQIKKYSEKLSKSNIIDLLNEQE